MSTFATATPRNEIVTSEASAVYIAKIGTTLTGINTLVDPATISGVRYLGETMGETTRVRGDSNKTVSLSVSEFDVRARKTATVAFNLAEFSHENQAFAQDLVIATVTGTGDLKFTMTPNESSQKTQWILIHDYVGELNGLQRDVYPCVQVSEDVTITDGRDTDLTGLQVTLKATKVGAQPLWTSYIFAADDEDDTTPPVTPTP